MDEVWHYEHWLKFDGRNDQSGAFSGYINKFLKLKVEASGWPKNIQTQEQKDKFLEDFEAREGIKLDPDKMVVNPGLRALSKLMLNSFWGL